MSRSVSSSEATESDAKISPKAYAAFVGQIELEAIWLNDAKVRNHQGPNAPERSSIRVDMEARCEDREGGFRAYCQYKVRVKAGNAPALNVDVTFGLDFSSVQPMTEEIFAIFSDVNLPINTWPYLREYVATTMGRMNWTAFTLPTFKRGTGQSSRAPRKAARATRVPASSDAKKE